MDIQTVSKLRLLFVCLGNICRSPAADGIMHLKAAERGWDEALTIDSAGIGGWHVGQLPDSRMRKHAAQRGYDLVHRARQFDKETDFDRFDYIFVMDEQNYSDLRSLARTSDDMEKVRYLGNYITHFGGPQVIPDPYYGGPRDFDFALDLIEDACDQLLDRIAHHNRL